MILGGLLTSINLAHRWCHSVEHQIRGIPFTDIIWWRCDDVTMTVVEVGPSSLTSPDLLATELFFPLRARNPFFEVYPLLIPNSTAHTHIFGLFILS